MNKKEHWIDDESKRKFFWAEAKERIGLTEDEVHEGLGVESVRDWEGSGQAAADRLWEYKAELDEARERYEALKGLGIGPHPKELAEAPASINFFGLTPQGWNVQFTLRDFSELTLMFRFTEMIRALDKLDIKPCDRNGNYVIRQEMIERATASVPTGPPPLPGQAAPPLPGQAAPAPTPEQSGNGNVFLTEFVRVTMPKDKPRVEFWRPNRQYAEIAFYLGGEKLLEMAPELVTDGWTAEHFDTVGGDYPLPLKVYWTPSERLDSRGNPYKDIVRIEKQ